MVRSPARSPARENPPRVSPFAAAREVAAGLAAAPSFGAALDPVLGRLADVATGSDRAGALSQAALWSAHDGAMTLLWQRGSGLPTTDDAAADLARGGSQRFRRGHPASLALRAAGEPVGLLFFRPLGRGGRSLELALRLIADLFAAAIAAERRRESLLQESGARAQELEAQERFIGRIVDALPVGVHVVDREYRVRAWNRNREMGLQGIRRGDALGRPIFEVLRRQPAATLRAEFDQVFSTGAPQAFEITTPAGGEGVPRTFRVSKIPMRVDAGEVTHVMTVGEDITDWRQAQERVAQAQKLAAVGQLAAGVMHEINNPLATIGACAESIMLRLPEVGPGAPLHGALTEYCRIIDHEVHRAKRIIDGLLDFSRPAASVKQTVDTNAVVEQTLFLLRHHPRFREMRVDAVLERAAPVGVIGNAEQLLQVYTALLLNATDATDGHGAVRITTARRDGEVTVEVRDDGRGIAARDLDRIFEPFFTTKSPGRGTGLGLSICYGIVADHGGRIEVESVAGEGSAFRVRLPAEGA